MPGNFKDRDARFQRTNGALMGAMSRLLDLRNFSKITVNDICVEAQISRATFYSHFQDKYDLLRHWMIKTKSAIITKGGAEKRINNFIDNNGKIIRHLIEDANSETLGLMCNFMFALLEMDMTGHDQLSRKHIVLSIFCCGGIMNYLELQAKKSIEDSEMMNSYLYDILNTLYKWNAEQD